MTGEEEDTNKREGKEREKKERKITMGENTDEKGEIKGRESSIFPIKQKTREAKEVRGKVSEGELEKER